MQQLCPLKVRKNIMFKKKEKKDQTIFKNFKSIFTFLFQLLLQIGLDFEKDNGHVFFYNNYSP